MYKAAESLNSKLDWNDNLAAIFEAKLFINRLSSSVLFYYICRPGDTIFLECIEIWCFYFDLRSNVMVYELSFQYKSK